MTGSLTFSQAEIIAQLLIDLGLGTDPTDNSDWPIYATEEPNEPDNVITIYDTVGTQDGRTMVDGEVQEHEGIQIKIRAINHDTGNRKANDLKIAIDQTIERDTVQVASILGTGTLDYFVQAVSRVSGPLALGEEVDSHRNVFTINAIVALREV